MSRASRRDNSISSSLFPFLAVLLCTMGVLVVLLSVMASVQVSQAKQKQQDEQAAAAEAVAQAKELYSSSEQTALRNRLQALQEQAKRVAERKDEAKTLLEDKQRQFAQLEENVRRRQDRLALLRNEIAELQALDDGSTDDLEQARREIARRQQLIVQAKADIEQLKQQVKNADKHFAIVPYNGTSGTRRQPIYIECRRDVIVFQPENIALTPADFNKELGSGSPLPAAIRAAQLYYESNGLTDKALPYPLVIARPDASTTLSIVLGMLQDLNTEFGYELVEQDASLDFSAADPALSEEIRRAIRLARGRLVDLQDRAPGRFASGQIYSFTPGDSRIEMVRRGELPSGYRAIGGSGGGSQGMVAAGGDTINPNQLAAAFESSGGTSSEKPEGWAPLAGQSGPYSNSPTPPSSSDSLAVNGTKQAQSSMTESTAASTLGPGGSSSTANGSTTPPSGPESQPAGDQAMEQAIASSLQKADSAGQSDLTTQGNATAGSSEAGDANGNANGNAAMAGTSPSDNNQQNRAAASPPKQPSTAGVAVTRPVRIQVYGDHLIVKSSKLSPGASDRVIKLGTDSSAAARSFIEAIHSEIEDWGMAGNGTYWKPVLNLSVTADGQALADRIAKALRQGGMEVNVAMLPKTSY